MALSGFTWYRISLSNGIRQHLKLRVHKDPKFEAQVMQSPLLKEAHLQSRAQQEKMQGRIQVLYTKQRTV
jgi:hypothetical protein